MNEEILKISLPKTDEILRENLQRKMDNKTKPLHSLGKLEDAAVRIGTIFGTENPEIKNPALLIFAADHGIAEEGISAYPQEVTYQMVMNFLQGGAAVNILCRENGIHLILTDSGVKFQFSEHSLLNSRKIREGTRNFLKEPAMTLEEFYLSVSVGRELVKTQIESGCNTFLFGEMGIGNTSSASLLTSIYLKMEITECTGRGTGLDDLQLIHKIKILEECRSRFKGNDAVQAFAEFGGYETAMIAGGMLEAASQGKLIIVDGFIVTSALLFVRELYPEIMNFCIFSHVSDEYAHKSVLGRIGAVPLLDLSMRLGEGSGAAVSLPLLKSALAILRDMASFESAGISGKK